MTKIMAEDLDIVYLLEEKRKKKNISDMGYCVPVGRENERQFYRLLCTCWKKKRTTSMLQVITYLLTKTNKNKKNVNDTGTCLHMWWWWWLFLHLREFWENVWLSISHLHFSPFFLLFLRCRLACAHYSNLMPGLVHSGSARWDDCGQMFPDELHVSSLPDRFPHYAWTAV